MMPVGSRVRRILGATLADGARVDVLLDEDGHVAHVTPATARVPAQHEGPGEDGDGVLDLTGYLLLPSGVEPHAHLDKAYSWDRVDPVYGDLITAITSWHGYSGQMTTEDVYTRARRALEQYLVHGITAIRTHVDLLSGDDPLRGLQAVTRLRDELREMMHIEVVLLASSLSPTEHILAALELGVDVMGGCPHLAVDPHAETLRMLDIAETAGLRVDFHTDEQLDPQMVSIRSLAAEVTRRGLQGRAAASHCVSLGTLPPEDLAPVVTEIAAAGLGIVSLPITNLYLQGRDDRHLTPRGITALRALLDAGVTVAAGADNLRDPFNPMGRADPFETTSLLVTAGHLDAHEALYAVTTAGRTILGLPPAGTAIGDRADLVAVRAPTLADALAGSGEGRLVFYRGRLVSRTTVSVEHSLALLPIS